MKEIVKTDKGNLREESGEESLVSHVLEREADS
jgi:hypothetical protein